MFMPALVAPFDRGHRLFFEFDLPVQEVVPVLRRRILVHRFLG